MRTRTFLITLAATAALTSCGVTTPASFEGKAGSLSSKVQAEQAFINSVRDVTDPDYVGDIDDATIIGFGDEVCDGLEAGDTDEDVAESIYDAAEGDMVAATQLAIIAGVAMRELCPELS